MPCTVKKTFEASAAAGALLIAQVKDNQPTLHQHVEQVCQSKAPVDQDTSRDANRRSRDETRLVEVFDPDAALADTEWAEHVGAVIRVSRTTHRRVTATGLWETTSEVAYFVCEFMLPAALCARAIRQHWAIENRSHYVRDCRKCLCDHTETDVISDSASLRKGRNSSCHRSCPCSYRMSRLANHGK